MSLKILFIIFLYINQIFNFDIQLNYKEKNDTISNKTVLNNTNQPIGLFNAQKLFTAPSCQCNSVSDIFYLSPETNSVNFTINTSSSNNTLSIENPNLYINSKKINSDYSLKKINNEIYKLQIKLICSNPESKFYNAKYKKLPSYNDNEMFGVLNFTFNYNKTEYHFSFIKFCSYEQKWKSIFSAGITFFIAVLYVYFSTSIELNFKSIKEAQKVNDVKW